MISDEAQPSDETVDLVSYLVEALAEANDSVSNLEQDLNYLRSQYAQALARLESIGVLTRLDN